MLNDPFTLAEDAEPVVETDPYRAWRKATKPFPEKVVEVLEVLQPYATARDRGERPEEQPLALLYALRRAERRRELLVDATGISQTALTVEGDTVYLAPVIHDGTVVHLSPTKVVVEVVAASHMGIGAAGSEMHPLPEVLDAIVDTIAHDVLPLLEPLLPSSADS